MRGGDFLGEDGRPHVRADDRRAGGVSCTTDDECDARADGCKLRFQYPNICSGGKCTLRCSSEFICQEFMGSSSTCVKDACTF